MNELSLQSDTNVCIITHLAERVAAAGIWRRETRRCGECGTTCPHVRANWGPAGLAGGGSAG